MIGLENAPARSSRVVAHRAQGDEVLLQLDTGRYYTLNEVGSRVWALCDGTTTLAQVVAIVHEEFDAPVAVVEVDVMELVAELADERLLVEAH